MQIRNVELLKLRFGDDALHLCEVMLKDIAESRRIRALLAERECGRSKYYDVGRFLIA